MSKLKIHQLTPYLPYKLKLKTQYGWSRLHSISIDEEIIINSEYEEPLKLEDVKPILIRLTSITKKDIREFGVVNDILEFTSNEYANIMTTQEDEKQFNVSELINKDIQWFFRNHYDVFGLIEKGIAVTKKY